MTSTFARTKTFSANWFSIPLFDHALFFFCMHVKKNPSGESNADDFHHTRPTMTMETQSLPFKSIILDPQSVRLPCDDFQTGTQFGSEQQRLNTSRQQNKVHTKTISATAACSGWSYRDLNSTAENQRVFDLEKEKKKKGKSKISCFQQEVFLGFGSAPSFLNLRLDISRKEKTCTPQTDGRTEGHTLGCSQWKKAKCGLLAGGRM